MINMGERTIPYPRLGLPHGTRITFASNSDIKELERGLDTWLMKNEDRLEILSIDYRPVAAGRNIQYTVSILYRKKPSK